MNLPYIICEVGLNHGGDWPTARNMIVAAKEAGADAVKFQYVKAGRLVSHRAPTYFQQTGQAVSTQHSFFARSDALDRADYEALAELCGVMGIDFLCTPFDVETVEWLNPLVPAFKIASADITNYPLLEAVRRTGKPVYLSTGAATRGEVRLACDTFYGSNKLTVLHCVLAYPTPPEQANLGAIWWDSSVLPNKLWDHVGSSDHTLFNLDVLTTAWLLGASVIEKHFTLDKTLPGNDHYHSMDPTDLRALVAKLKELQAMIGDGEKRVLPCEEAARLNARQSWHATMDLDAGQTLFDDMVTLKRPGTGCPASMNMVGKLLSRPVRADEPITLEHLAYRECAA